MIWESYYWKESLLKDRKYLLRFRCNDTTTEKTLVEIEKKIFVDFYSIRKLIEANKISTSNADSNWTVYSYKNISRVDIMNWYKIDAKYNLGKEQQEKKNLLWICNQFIHSFVFVLNFDNFGKLSSFYISSDRERNIKLYQIRRKEFLDILRLIGYDYPAYTEMNRNKDGDWVVNN